MLTRKSSAVILSLALLSESGIAYADFVDGLVGGAIGGVLGSVITNEVYHHNARRRTHRVHRIHRHRVRRAHHVRHVHRTPPPPPPSPQSTYRYRPSPSSTPVLSEEKKIQRSLSALGFYHGSIDGKIDSYETREAIRALNTAYERGNSGILDAQAKDALRYLSTLFTLDRYLVARDTDARTRWKKVQAALKIYGTYHGKIDGIVGSRTRAAIAAYTGGSSSLSIEEEYRLIKRAKKKNDRNIENAIASLKGQKEPPSAYYNKTQRNQPVVLQPAN